MSGAPPTQSIPSSWHTYWLGTLPLHRLKSQTHSRFPRSGPPAQQISMLTWGSALPCPHPTWDQAPGLSRACSACLDTNPTSPYTQPCRCYSPWPYKPTPTGPHKPAAPGPINTRILTIFVQQDMCLAMFTYICIQTYTCTLFYKSSMEM